MQSRALSEEAWEADLALLAPSPEDSGSGLTNTLLNGHKGGDCDGFSTFDVPIFTEEFLDQNKGERRLGLLRGSRCQGRGWAIRAPRQRQEVGGIYP